jgi:glycogen synthase
MYIVDRTTKDFNSSAEDLANMMLRIVNSTRKERINMRNKSEDLSECFDWKNLYSEYEKAYIMATQRETIGA